jgi:hypothetical protein
MRDLRVSERVTAVLGQGYVARLRRGSAPGWVRCAVCAAEEELDAGQAMAVLVEPAPDGLRVMFAHAFCSPSRVLPTRPDPFAGQLWRRPAITGHALTVPGAPPALAVETDIVIHTATAGGELVDTLLATLLGRGLALVPALDGPTLTGLPTLPGWMAWPTHAGQAIQVRADDGDPVYGGTLDTVPAGWLGTLAARRRLALLVASRAGLAPTTTDPARLVAAAARDGRLVGGLVALGRPTRP